MPDRGPSLSDVLVQVPVLLPLLLTECSANFGARDEMMRDLRLVSKDTSITVMREVTQCSVQLGEGAFPNPAQVIRLMQYSKLQSLHITINTTSARTGPLLAQQLATCTSQATELVQGMGTAIKSVTSLSVNVQHDLISTSRNHAAFTRSLSEPPRGCPASFSVISRAVCTALAVATPLLDTLNVSGCCRDVAFDVFGSVCPKLVELEVEALSVPLKALKNLDRHLPHLQIFTLTSPDEAFLDDPEDVLVKTYLDRLSEYVGGSLQALQTSTSVRRMALAFHDLPSIRCRPGRWRHVPASLEEFVARRGVRDLQEAPELLGQLRTLFLEGTDPLDVLPLVRLAPRLQSLLALGSGGVVLKCDATDTAASISLLRQRMRKGLTLVMPSFALEGSCASVQAALAAVPSLCSTHKLLINLQGEVLPEMDFLEHVARVFPGLKTLVLQSHGLPQNDPAVGIELLEPLQDCRLLHTLQLHMHHAVTTEELVWLFKVIGSLGVLGFVESEGVDVEGVKEGLAALGNPGVVEQYRRVGHL